MVASALQLSGLRVGIYTSPHLVDVRERIVVAGRPIPREAFAGWVQLLAGSIEGSGASFFEATTAIALADFAARGVDVAVVEVGLGGRLDATNVLDPLVSGVVNVAMEHTDYLGNSLESIAREKAGIAKPGRPFVVGEPREEVAAVLASVAADAGAEVHVLDPGRVYDGAMGMVGRHQKRNAAIAATMLDLLPPCLAPDRTSLEDGIASAWLPGRFDRRGKWLFDVAHNPHAMVELADALQESGVPRPVHAVVGMLRDKAAAEALRVLRSAVDCIWVTIPPSAPSDRRADLSALGGGPDLDLRADADFERALQAAAKNAGTVLVTGSFHTVGDAMARLPGFAPLG